MSSEDNSKTSRKFDLNQNYNLNSGLDMLNFPHIQRSFTYDEKHLWNSAIEASQHEATSIKSPHSTGDLLVITSMYGIPAYLSEGTQNRTSF